MRVLLLGTSGYHPTATRHTACVLLPELGIVLDAGTGMFRVGQYLTTDTIDIFLSHAHLDHVVGLTYFFTLMHERPHTRVTVHGQREKLVAIREHLFATELFPANAPFDWHSLAGKTNIHGTDVRAFPLDHPGGSLGFRIDYAGKSLAYVTDTTATQDAPYIHSIQDVDLLLHECNFPNGHEAIAERTGHSSLDQVVQVAIAARAKRLVLIHFDPVLAIPPEQLAKAREQFPALELGYDLCELEV